jgi:hypothetical protein
VERRRANLAATWMVRPVCFSRKGCVLNPLICAPVELNVQSTILTLPLKSVADEIIDCMKYLFNKLIAFLRMMG